ncbi:hypothetical protein [Micromonospora sp. I033]
MTRQAGDTFEVTELPGLTLAHPSVQPRPRARVLVVGARCRWRKHGPDHNAVIYGSDGRIEAQATLRCGIEHVCTTTSGEVWVATSTKAFMATTAGAIQARRRRWARATAAEQVRVVWWDGPHVLAGSDHPWRWELLKGDGGWRGVVHRAAFVVGVHVRADLCRR